MKRIAKPAAAVILAYLVMLCLLVLSERGTDGSIQSFGDAVWYSMVTLTTVGYGDLYPVSTVGRVIGGFLVLMSVGLLTSIISVVLALVSGRMLPGLRLWLNRRKQWWIFSENNEAARVLAQDLLHHHPGTLAVFCCGEKDSSVSDRLSVPYSPQELMHRKAFFGNRRAVFLIGEDRQANRAAAAEFPAGKASVYCRSEETSLLPEVTFFNPEEACARNFWQQYPPEEAEQVILILHAGQYAKALLNQAIVANCMTPLRTIEYHMAGDWAEYLRSHYRLGQCFSLNCREEGKDCLYFHEEAILPELLTRADRVIICGDNPAENAQQALELTKWIPLSGKLYVLTEDTSVPGIHFGMSASLYTEKLVMQQELDAAARQMHEKYRIQNGGPEWKELSLFGKASNRAAADHLFIKRQLKPGSTRDQRRRNEHDRWLRFHSLYNWTYATQRNNLLRYHPCMLPYDELCAEDQEKDDYAWILTDEDWGE